MAFQALLFCPDEKTARTVTQVLNELEFEVDPCIEPFAAVKKLMSGHFDALVVDCDNEQNATLLFKSARNSTSNQTSLAVAIVEGQAGVAKAFRIGANLVLTKPINVEQSKGTLRVARGLLRKGEPVKPGMPAVPAASAPSAPVPSTNAPAASSLVATAKPVAAKPVPQKTNLPPKPVPAASAPKTPAVSSPNISSSPVAPASPVPAAAVSRKPIPPAAPSPASVAAAQVAASSGLDEPDESSSGSDSTHIAPASPALHKTAVPAQAKPPATSLASSFGSGAASAPAPAREADHTEPPVEASHIDSDTSQASAQSSASEFSKGMSAPAPSFTFGGANASEETDGGSKKIFIGIAAVVLVAVLGFGAYSHFSSQPASSGTAAVPAPPTSSTATPVSAQPAATKPAAPAPTDQTPTQTASAPSSDVNSTAASPTGPASAESEGDSSVAESAPAVVLHSAAKPSTGSASSAGKSAAPAKAEPAPMVVKGGAVPHTKTGAPVPDVAAPTVDAIAAPASSGALSNLVGNASAPKPVLQTVNISQGVSQGLLIKKVQPVYPKTAIAMRLEGEVDLAATISKTGDITSVKALKGDPQLAKAAADAVKQWKYKPYLLNGEPVEITTQVTINFKLPN